MEILKLDKVDSGKLRRLYLQCCGSETWTDEMLRCGKFESKEDMIEHSRKIWYSLEKEDWLEAFKHHPKIGDINSLKEKYSNTKSLARNEQSEVEEASAETLEKLAKFNSEYEKKFGYIFIVCATGKSAEEMLSLIRERINNDPETEIKTAMEEQSKITKLRLEKLL